MCLRGVATSMWTFRGRTGMRGAQRSEVEHIRLATGLAPAINRMARPQRDARAHGFLTPERKHHVDLRGRSQRRPGSRSTRVLVSGCITVGGVRNHADRQKGNQIASLQCACRRWCDLCWMHLFDSLSGGVNWHDRPVAFYLPAGGCGELS